HLASVARELRQRWGRRFGGGWQQCRQRRRRLVGGRQPVLDHGQPDAAERRRKGSPGQRHVGRLHHGHSQQDRDVRQAACSTVALPPRLVQVVTL
ncbi:hypothetical protein V5799_002604, partial [Amblyomma americanum]